MSVQARKEVSALVAVVVIGAVMLSLGARDSLDVKFYYSAEQARAFFAALTAEQAKVYLHAEFFDLGFLSAYSTLAYLLLRRFVPARPSVARLGLIPGAYDLVETLTIICVLTGALNEAPWWLGCMTCIKWTSGAFVVARLAFEMIRKMNLRSRATGL